VKNVYVLIGPLVDRQKVQEAAQKLIEEDAGAGGSANATICPDGNCLLMDDISLAFAAALDQMESVLSRMFDEGEPRPAAELLVCTANPWVFDEAIKDILQDDTNAFTFGALGQRVLISQPGFQIKRLCEHEQFEGVCASIKTGIMQVSEILLARGVWPKTARGEK
jgi:hypothetical protein